MRPIILFISLTLVFLGVLLCSAEPDQDYVSRIEARLTISVSDANSTLYFAEGDDFNVSAKASCFNATCDRVDIFLFYCSGVNCREFRAIGTDSFYPVYTKEEEASYTCLMTGKGQSCSNSWRIRAKKTGSYVLMFFAQSTNTQMIRSDPIFVKVSGCGDGLCQQGETVSVCPQDCCEKDCTAVGDDLCDTRCRDYLNCSISPDCSGKTAGLRQCVSNSSYISCCSLGIKMCEYGEYCGKDYCTTCAQGCDGICKSSACYRIDPDCDEEGRALLACCGNGVIDSGEECDGLMGVCPSGCDQSCRCIIPVTVTSIKEASTLLVASSSTSSKPIETTTSVSSTTTSLVDGIDEPAKEQESGLGAWLPLVLFFVAVCLILFLLVFLGQRKMVETYDMLKNQEEDLEKARAKVFSDYSSGGVPEDAASRMVLGYDNELAAVRKKIASIDKNLMKK